MPVCVLCLNGVIVLTTAKTRQNVGGQQHFLWDGGGQLDGGGQQRSAQLGILVGCEIIIVIRVLHVVYDNM